MQQYNEQSRGGVRLEQGGSFMERDTSLEYPR